MERFPKEQAEPDLVEPALLLVCLALADTVVLPTSGNDANIVFSQTDSTLTSGA
jgi:hypothetical protein